MSSFSTLHVALSGLRAAQLQIDTASHNIANASTPGFTRQRVEQAARPPRTLPLGQLGTGVDVTAITRSRDAFLDQRARTGADVLGRLQARADLLARTESINGEPESGIGTELSKLWSALEEWSLDPSDSAGRLGVLASLESLSGRVRATSHGWELLGTDAETSVGDLVGEVNDTLTSIAAINRSIGESPSPPNDLLDQRDLLLDRVAKLIGADAHIDDQGRARVILGGMNLVESTQVNHLAYDPSTHEVTHPAGVGVNTGGEIVGKIQFLSNDLPGLQTSLNSWVEDLTVALNAAHANAYRDPGVAGGDLLTHTPGLAAATLSVAITDPAQLAAAGSSGPPFPVHDGRGAQALAALATSDVADGATSTLEEAARRLAVDLGQRTAAAIRARDSQYHLQVAGEQARANAHGVSLDEEMVALLSHQRAYEAAARVMTTVDQALDVLINRMGIVGR